jgi:hypothetical protein
VWRAAQSAHAAAAGPVRAGGREGQEVQGWFQQRTAHTRVRRALQQRRRGRGNAGTTRAAVALPGPTRPLLLGPHLANPQGCGLVVEAHIIDERSEWRTFGDKDKEGDDPSRVGGATNLLLEDGGLGTMIGRVQGDGGASFALNKMHMRQNNVARQLKGAFAAIGEMCAKLNQSDAVKGAACEIYKNVGPGRGFRVSYLGYTNPRTPLSPKRVAYAQVACISAGRQPGALRAVRGIERGAGALLRPALPLPPSCTHSVLCGPCYYC